MKTDSQPVRLSDYKAPDYTIETVDLDFRLDHEATKVHARIRFRPNVAAPSGTLVLDGDDLTLTHLALDGALVHQDRYDVTPDRLTIEGVPNGPFTLEIGTEINPSANTQLMGLYRTTGAYCTQCEAEGFRRITYFLDRPDVLAVYTTRVEARKAEAPVLLANGNPVEAGELPHGRHFAVWHDPFPKPAYLFALVAGDLGVVTDSFTTMSGRKVELRIYCEHGKEPRCAYAMDSLKRSMRWDEKVFGREYDLDIFMIVAVSEFNMGAMENKGLNVFNDKYVLADPDTATDGDYAGIEGVIAHEYFHNWTGNRITCRDWFQLCLKEGLTVFRDQEFSSDERSRPVKRISDVRTLQARQFSEDAGPLAHPVRPEVYHEINNFYTATVYEKGAELVRMLKTLLGPETFRAGMDLYFERHDGEAATVEDFLAAFADAGKIDLAQFKLWYEQAGTPELAASGKYDATAKRYQLSLAQNVPATPGQPSKKPMPIPVRFGLVGPNGEDLAFTKMSGAAGSGDVLVLTEPSQTVVFEGVSAKPVPSLLRGFSAPVKLSLDLSAADLLFLLRTDADAFNRWQASQVLAMRALIAGTALAKTGATPSADPALIDAYGEVAANEALEPAFRAQVLHLPSESDIAREIGRDVDPEAIFTARSAFRAAIADRIGGKLAGLYDGLASSGPYSPDAKAAGRRALRNALLDLIVANRSATGAARAVEQFHDADNMTDRMAALATLCQGALPARHAALDAFARRYAEDHLALDKWFTLQAITPSPETLDQVRALMDHPGFSMGNPNRIRALIGGFAAGNQKEFNRADGAGYDFLADIVLSLDRRNPQTAARLLVSFRSWRALEGGRRGKAEAALKRIAGTDELSRDTRDIITRTLA
ncbi:MAG: aminopeptidase N [Bauldia sp.]